MHLGVAGKLAQKCRARAKSLGTRHITMHADWQIIPERLGRVGICSRDQGRLNLMATGQADTSRGRAAKRCIDQ